MFGSCASRRSARPKASCILPFETAATKARSIRFGIARIEPQRLAKERRRGHRIVLCARDKRREIIAGGAFANLERRRDGQIVAGPGFRAREGAREKPMRRGRDAAIPRAATRRATPVDDHSGQALTRSACGASFRARGDFSAAGVRSCDFSRRTWPFYVAPVASRVPKKLRGVPAAMPEAARHMLDRTGGRNHDCFTFKGTWSQSIRSLLFVLRMIFCQKSCGFRKITLNFSEDHALATG